MPQPGQQGDAALPLPLMRWPRVCGRRGRDVELLAEYPAQHLAGLGLGEGRDELTRDGVLEPAVAP